MLEHTKRQVNGFKICVVSKICPRSVRFVLCKTEMAQEELLMTFKRVPYTFYVKRDWADLFSRES